MKLDLKLHAGSQTSDHQVELPSAGPERARGGVLRFVLDGETVEADWAEITPGIYSILVGGRSYEARVTPPPAGSVVRENPSTVTVGARHYLVEARDPRARRHAAATGAPQGPQEVVAPMPGKIVKILVAEKQEVSQGEGLLVIEAMKMQNELRAPRSGRVERIYVLEGTGVETGFKLLRLA